MIGDASLEIPDLAEPIVGWRCWVISEIGGGSLLKSPNNALWWPPVVPHENQVVRSKNYVTARCTRDVSSVQHKCPSPTEFGHNGMGCGIYAFKTIEDLAWDFPLKGISRHPLRPASSKMVWGKCLLWGDVWEHERGYRAEFSRIESLAYCNAFGEMSLSEIQGVADFYRVPVEVIPDSALQEIEAAIATRPDAASVVRLTLNAMDLFEVLKEHIAAMRLSMSAAVDAILEFANKSSDDQEEESESEEDDG